MRLTIRKTSRFCSGESFARGLWYGDRHDPILPLCFTSLFGGKDLSEDIFDFLLVRLRPT